MRPMGLVKKLKNYNFFRFLTRAGESNCCLRKFGEVGPFCELYGADVVIDTENNLDNSGSDETMQKDLVSIV